jgi:ABC-type branched-subunit amino acid transport system ATPase component
MEALLNACRANPNHRDLLENVAALIATLSAQSPSYAEQLKRLGAVDILMDALQRFPHSDILLQAATTALKVMTGESDMDRALATMVTGDTRTDVKFAQALANLSSLLLVDDNVAYMFKKAGLDWLMSALIGQLNNPNHDAVCSHDPVFCVVLSVKLSLIMLELIIEYI